MEFTISLPFEPIRNPESSTDRNQINNTTKMLLNQTGSGMVHRQKGDIKTENRTAKNFQPQRGDRHSRTLILVPGHELRRSRSSKIRGGGDANGRATAPRVSPPNKKKSLGFAERLNFAAVPTGRGSCHPKRLNTLLHPCPASREPCRKRRHGRGTSRPPRPLRDIFSRVIMWIFVYSESSSALDSPHGTGGDADDRAR